MNCIEGLYKCWGVTLRQLSLQTDYLYSTAVVDIDSTTSVVVVGILLIRARPIVEGLAGRRVLKSPVRRGRVVETVLDDRRGHLQCLFLLQLQLKVIFDERRQVDIT